MTITPLPTATQRDDALWQVELFSGRSLPAPARGHVSARCAYQDVLHDRAVLVDLRPDSLRDAEGRLGVPVLEVRPGADLSGLRRARRVYVVAGPDGHDPAELAALAPGRPEVLAVAGGFVGWRSAGLPLAGA